MKVQLGRYSLSVDLQALGLFALLLVWRVWRPVVLTLGLEHV